MQSTHAMYVWRYIYDFASCGDRHEGVRVFLTAWPRLRGWISRKARTFSFSNSYVKAGISSLIAGGRGRGI